MAGKAGQTNERDVGEKRKRERKRSRRCKVDVGEKRKKRERRRQWRVGSRCVLGKSKRSAQCGNMHTALTRSAHLENTRQNALTTPERKEAMG
jgi:hypothetical protein